MEPWGTGKEEPQLAEKGLSVPRRITRQDDVRDDHQGQRPKTGSR